MQTILYTAPTEIENEIEIISTLMDIGVDYLYIRKPDLDDFSLVDFKKKIQEKYWKQCISTSLIITKEFNLGGYHFTRDILQKNINYNDKILDWLRANKKIASVSAHQIDDITKYDGQFNHIIVSPIFKSISKENHHYHWDFDALSSILSQHKTAKKFAIGGLEADAQKINIIKNCNFDGIGILGAIWNEPKNAIEQYQKLQQLITDAK